MNSPFVYNDTEHEVETGIVSVHSVNLAGKDNKKN